MNRAQDVSSVPLFVFLTANIDLAVPMVSTEPVIIVHAALSPPDPVESSSVLRI